MLHSLSPGTESCSWYQARPSSVLRKVCVGMAWEEWAFAMGLEDLEPNLWVWVTSLNSLSLYFPISPW